MLKTPKQIVSQFVSHPVLLTVIPGTKILYVSSNQPTGSLLLLCSNFTFCGLQVVLCHYVCAPNKDKFLDHRNESDSETLYIVPKEASFPKANISLALSEFSSGFYTFFSF